MSPFLFMDKKRKVRYPAVQELSQLNTLVRKDGMLISQLSRLWLRMSLASDVLFGFPYRLVTLYWFIKKRRLQCTDFTVRDIVRCKAPTKHAMNSRVVVPPSLQGHFSELGEPDEAGNRELQPQYIFGSAAHSFYVARDHWQVISVNCDIAVRTYLIWNRYPLHPCILTVRNPSITMGDTSSQYIGGDMVEKVIF